MRCVLIGLWLVVAALADRSVSGVMAGENASLRAVMQQALTEGFEIGQKPAEAAREQLARARSLAPDDPRVPYAAGLVFLKQLQRTEAAAEFERAAGSASHPYWPAWRAWVWCGFRERDLTAGTKRLEALIKVISESRDESSDLESLAFWCGTVLGAVQRTETDAPSQMRLMECEARLRETLDPVLEDALDEGLFSLNAVEDDLERLAREADRRSRLRQEKRLAEEKKQIAAALERIAVRQEATRRTAEDWKVWMEEELKRQDRELSTLSKGQAHLQKRAASLQLSIFSKIGELSALEDARGRAVSPDAKQALDLQLQRCRGELSLLQIELTTAMGTAGMAARQQSQKTVVRQGTIQQYDRAADALARRQSAMNKLSDRVKSRLTVRPRTDARAPGRHTFVELVPFDLKVLRQELIESF